MDCYDNRCINKARNVVSVFKENSCVASAFLCAGHTFELMERDFDILYSQFV